MKNIPVITMASVITPGREWASRAFVWNIMAGNSVTQVSESLPAKDIAISVSEFLNYNIFE